MSLGYMKVALFETSSHYIFFLDAPVCVYIYIYIYIYIYSIYKILALNMATVLDRKPERKCMILSQG